MSAPSPAPPQPRWGRWLTIAGALALFSFTALTVRDAGQSAVRPEEGGTFTGHDVDGRFAQICLFPQEGGWQGWFYREGREQTEWFTTTNRAHSWREPLYFREPEEGAKPPAPTVESTSDPLRLNATLPRTNGWASDTANLTRQFEHLSYRRLSGLRLWGWGGTKEFIARFPKLPAGSKFHAAITREIIHESETSAAEFTADPLEFWHENWELRGPSMMNTHAFTAHWQLRLLTTNLASFCVWSYDDVGGNGNHSRWHGVNFMRTPDGAHMMKLADLFLPAGDWPQQMRNRCAAKLRAISVRESIAETALENDTSIENFTVSPTGLQIYFNPYEIATGADGEFVVHFDYTELKDLLRTNGPAALLPHLP